MKKIFLSMLTAVALFASCSQEELVSQTSGEESMVSFTLTTPEMGSRVVGDGTTATDLYFVVYDETTDEQVETISSKTTKYAGFKGMNATVSLPLLNGHKYSLLFWAESAKGVYDVNWDTRQCPKYCVNEKTGFRYNLLYLDSVFKYKNKLVHNQPPIMNWLCPFLLNFHQ